MGVGRWVVLVAVVLVGCGAGSGKSATATGGSFTDAGSTGSAGSTNGTGGGTSQGDAGPPTTVAPNSGDAGASGTGASSGGTSTTSGSPPGGGISSSGGSTSSAGADAGGACAGLAAPTPVDMRTYVRPGVLGTSCGPGVGDASGTLALPLTFLYASAHGSTVDFVSSGGEVLSSYTTPDAVRLLQQPHGFAGTAVPRYGPPILVQLRWDARGTALQDGLSWVGDHAARAADPGGGLLVAGELSTEDAAHLQHVAVMFSGGGEPYGVRWGPAPLASPGSVRGAGVDAAGRSLVITDGSTGFGQGAISAQWFDRGGSPLTGEFLLVKVDPLVNAWIETSPLVGGGVVVQLVTQVQGGVQVRALALVQGGTDTVEPIPEWLKSRPGTRLQLVRGGRGYAVVPYGATGVACSQRIELLAPDGTSCGSVDFPIAQGTCDTGELSVGEDGTVIQQLPLAMETRGQEGPPYAHTCTWRFWPALLK